MATPDLAAARLADRDVANDTTQPSVNFGADGLKVFNSKGTAIVFDSFSPEDEVGRRNTVRNSISRINDPSRHFLMDFNISVQGSVSAVLSPSTVASYCVPDRKGGKEPVDRIPVAQRHFPAVVEATEFDEAIERSRKRCRLLFGDTTPPVSPAPSSAPSWSPPPPPLCLRGEEDQQRFPSAVEEETEQGGFMPLSFASALLQAHHRGPNRLRLQPLPAAFTPFGDVHANFAPPLSSSSPTPNSSCESITVCTIPTRDLIRLPTLLSSTIRNNSDELMAISTLTSLRARSVCR